MVSIADLLAAGVIEEARGSGELRISDVKFDSRQVQEGDLFVAVDGLSQRGSDFASQALDKGAVAIATESWLDLPAPQLRVADARAAIGHIAQRVWGAPTERLCTIGVTGTNGKSTTVEVLRALLAQAGGDPISLGTLGVHGVNAGELAPRTTPEGNEIARVAATAVDEGKTHLVMEVSSHALALRRVAGMKFEVAAWTNLSQDHLDFHRTMEAYFAEKSKLFFQYKPRHAVINVDDAWGRTLAESIDSAQTSLVTVSRNPDAQATLCVVATDQSLAGTTLEITGLDPWAAPLRTTTSLIGEHNTANIAVALGVMRALEVPIESSLSALACLQVPGRLESVADAAGELRAFVDYAHTPDALSHVLSVLRKRVEGRLWVVVGAGGDRDRSKRRPMGRAAAALADRVVITSDNPRGEDPESIVHEVLAGVEASPADERVATDLWTILDRRAAIQHAVASMVAGDCLLVAGKGHETYQLIGEHSLPFDDRVEVKRALAQRRRRSTGARPS